MNNIWSLIMAIIGLLCVIAGLQNIAMWAFVIGAIYGAEYEICKAIRELKK